MADKKRKREDSPNVFQQAGKKPRQETPGSTTKARGLSAKLLEKVKAIDSPPPSTTHTNTNNNTANNMVVPPTSPEFDREMPDVPLEAHHGLTPAQTLPEPKATHPPPKQALQQTLPPEPKATHPAPQSLPAVPTSNQHSAFVSPSSAAPTPTKGTSTSTSNHHSTFVSPSTAVPTPTKGTSTSASNQHSTFISPSTTVPTPTKGTANRHINITSAITTKGTTNRHINITSPAAFTTSTAASNQHSTFISPSTSIPTPTKGTPHSTFATSNQVQQATGKAVPWDEWRQTTASASTAAPAVLFASPGNRGALAMNTFRQPANVLASNNTSGTPIYNTYAPLPKERTPYPKSFQGLGASTWDASIRLSGRYSSSPNPPSPSSPPSTNEGPPPARYSGILFLLIVLGTVFTIYFAYHVLVENQELAQFWPFSLVMSTQQAILESEVELMITHALSAIRHRAGRCDGGPDHFNESELIECLKLKMPKTHADFDTLFQETKNALAEAGARVMFPVQGISVPLYHASVAITPIVPWNCWAYSIVEKYMVWIILAVVFLVACVALYLSIRSTRQSKHQADKLVKQINTLLQERKSKHSTEPWIPIEHVKQRVLEGYSGNKQKVWHYVLSKIVSDTTIRETQRIVAGDPTVTWELVDYTRG